jgi:hypothetical protein
MRDTLPRTNRLLDGPVEDEPRRIRGPRSDDAAPRHGEVENTGPFLTEPRAAARGLARVLRCCQAVVKRGEPFREWAVWSTSSMTLHNNQRRLLPRR